MRSVLVVLFYLYCQNLLADSVLTVFERVADVEEVRGTFIQKRLLRGLPVPLVSSGSFEYSVDGTLVWRSLKPLVSEFTISKNSLEGNDSGFGSEVFSEILLAVFDGNADTLMRYFSTRYEAVGGGWRVFLSPKNDDFSAFISLLTLEGSTFIDQVRIDERHGDSSVIFLTTVEQ